MTTLWIERRPATFLALGIAPQMGLETKTKGFLHMSKACRHRCVTLIMRSGFSPRGEPLGFEPPL